MVKGSPLPQERCKHSPVLPALSCPASTPQPQPGEPGLGLCAQPAGTSQKLGVKSLLHSTLATVGLQLSATIRQGWIWDSSLFLKDTIFLSDLLSQLVLQEHLKKHEGWVRTWNFPPASNAFACHSFSRKLFKSSVLCSVYSSQVPFGFNFCVKILEIRWFGRGQNCARSFLKQAKRFLSCKEQVHVQRASFVPALDTHSSGHFCQEFYLHLC